VAAGFVLAAVVVAAVVLRRDEPAVADAPSLVVEMDGAVAPAPLPGVGSGAPAGVERDGAGASVVVASADGGAAGEARWQPAPCRRTDTRRRRVAAPDGGWRQGGGP
jgi:hypothetical protein